MEKGVQGRRAFGRSASDWKESVGATASSAPLVRCDIAERTVVMGAVDGMGTRALIGGDTAPRAICRASGAGPRLILILADEVGASSVECKSGGGRV